MWCVWLNVAFLCVHQFMQVWRHQKPNHFDDLKIKYLMNILSKRKIRLEMGRIVSCYKNTQYFHVMHTFQLNIPILKLTNQHCTRQRNYPTKICWSSRDSSFQFNLYNLRSNAERTSKSVEFYLVHGERRWNVGLTANPMPCKYFDWVSWSLTGCIVDVMHIEWYSVRLTFSMPNFLSILYLALHISWIMDRLVR